ncbi:MAG TPA: nuclear transport factor 2 family protein [Myxococcota bacterium]|nr:nuclear transport factor 2 family protein [Myxococcota bacterium]
MDANRLADLEAIKQLKARYFRLMDTKQWALWADVFCEDCSMQSGPADSPAVRGRDAIVRYVRGFIERVITVHHGHMPEIEFTGPDSATGVWAMYDQLRGPGFVLDGWGHYHEEYRRCADGRWRIASTRLTRLRVESPDPALVASLWPESAR